MESLRAYCSTFADYIGSTPAAVYERQRVLVRAGLLELDGRGRGGGTKATPESVALLLIAHLAVDTLVGAERVVRSVANAKALTAKISNLLGADTFAQGVARVLSSPTLANRTSEIVVSRTSLNSSIEVVGPVDHIPSGTFYFHFSANSRKSPSYRVEARIDGDFLAAIATDLAFFGREGQ